MEGGHARGWINAHGWINVLIKQSSHSPTSTSATQIICRIRCHEEEDADFEVARRNLVGLTIGQSFAGGTVVV